MAGLKSYTTEVNGIRTTLRLSDADAKTRGLTADKTAAAPANKSRTAATNK